MSGYPRMLYRPGTEVRVWNEHDCDTRIVRDADEEAAALEGGWHLHPSCEPLDRDGDGRKGGSLPGRRKKGTGE